MVSKKMLFIILMLLLIGCGKTQPAAQPEPLIIVNNDEISGYYTGTIIVDRAKIFEGDIRIDADSNTLLITACDESRERYE